MLFSLRTFGLILIFAVFSFGRQSALPDSSLKAQPELPRPMPKPLLLHDLWHDLSIKIDSSKVITFAELDYLGYHGVADLFRDDPRVQTFDFLEMGLPRYFSGLHLWPWQSNFHFNGFLLNDPTHGMYNAQMISADALSWMSRGLPSSSMTGINVFSDFYFQSRAIFQDEPYTRIMYREGDFAYTDLDITFANQLNNKTFLQLGGINRDYSPNYQRSSHYRGQLGRLLNNHLLMRLLYHKSNENVSFNDYYGAQYGRFRYNESRQNIYSQWFWLNDQHQPDWQLDAGFESSRRKYRFTAQTERLRFDRYLVQFNKKFTKMFLPFAVQIKANQVKAWGTPYSRKYTDSQLDAGFTSSWQARSDFKLDVQLNLAHRWAQTILLNPYLKITWGQKPFSLNASFNSYGRLPTINERFFHFNGIDGQRSLKPERHFNSQFTIETQATPWAKTQFGLVMHRINNEINFNNQRFYNAGDRYFNYLFGKASFTVHKFLLNIGGQSAVSGELIGADYSAFAHARYSDRWYHDRVLVKASATLQWQGPAKILAYQPYSERFFLAGGKWPEQLLLHYKVSATIKDAVFFLEMDNALGQQYQIIQGYPELYRRVRVGLSWVLWN